MNWLWFLGVVAAIAWIVAIVDMIRAAVSFRAVSWPPGS